MSRVSAWLGGVSQAIVGETSTTPRKPGPRNGGITDANLYAALAASAGLVGPTAEKLDVSYQAVWQRVQKDPEAQRIIAEVKSKATDIAETHLLNGVRRGDWEKVKFWLQTQGKTRGYAPSAELSGPGGAPIATDVAVTIRYVHPKPELDDG